MHVYLMYGSPKPSHKFKYRIAGYFREVLIFVIFVGHLLVTKISTHENNLVGC